MTTRKLRSSTTKPPPTEKTPLPNNILPDLTAEETQTLRKKQHRLRSSAAALIRQASAHGAPIANALQATLIFAQHEAGTAVCIHPRGWVLTCAHCFGESEAEWRASRRKWLLDYVGRAVQVECRVWDVRRDLALACVVAVEGVDGAGEAAFAFVALSGSAGTNTNTGASTGAGAGTGAGMAILCIGQPGADDLESEVARETGYDLMEISKGRLRGLVPGKDPQDNEEIGTLMHDAWTYWGHSGAPLLDRENGELLGLHSSWDEETAMRHGVPLVAIQEFLAMHGPSR